MRMMGRYSGERVLTGPVQVRPASVKIAVSWLILGWTIRRAVQLVSWLLRHPSAIVAAGVVTGLWALQATYGPVPLLGIIAAISALLGVWYWQHPTSYRRLVAWPARTVWRRAWVYRRGWNPAMTTCGLVARYRDTEFLPRLRRVRSTASVDRVRVKMLPGQVLDNYAQAAEQLAMTFGALDCRVRSGKLHGEVELWFLIRDPLTDPVDPFEPADPPDLLALPVALREDGLIYRLALLGTHLLIGGATGSGKGSVLWSIVHALCPGIRSGLVSLWVLDPKGGMEFASGQRLFTRYCYGDDTITDEDEQRSYELGFAEFLERGVAIMRDRQARLRGVTRLHEPTPDDPYIVILVDELASLTAYITDREAKQRIRAALSLLLSQGRAVGVTVVAALQDPRKEVLPFRDLFPTRLALRLSEPEQVGMILGDGARDRGARCDKIAESLPGVGYVTLDGVAEPLRVRFSFITDTHINGMVEVYPPPRGLRPVEGGEAA
ncbi:MAG: cell division protein FtsK [Propionibacteriales bacterium]|nr:cell division protein FtsK [Propionibacteriales bacterium]